MAISGENLSAGCAMLALMGWCAGLCELPALVRTGYPGAAVAILRARLLRPARRRVVMHRQARILRVIHRSGLWHGRELAALSCSAHPSDQER
jgi:hypothetical protein